MDLLTLRAVLSLDTSTYESGLSGAESHANTFANKISKIFSEVGKAVSKALDISIDFAKDSVSEGMEFDKAMSAVAAISEATGSEFDSLREKAMEMGEKTKFTATESANAFYYMAMAGWKTEDMLAGIEGVMSLAAASGEDLAKVSDIVTDSMTAFGMAADGTTNGISNVQYYADILATTAANSNTDVSRMGETFKYIAPIAGSLGADIDDVAMSIGLMASSGIKGSQAGTALRNILTRLSTNAGETNKDLGALTILTEKLGVQFWDASGKMRDWGDIIMESRESWKGLTEEQQVYYAKQIGSQRGMAAWMTLMNASEKDVEKLTKALGDSAGAAEEMSEQRLDNLAGDITLFNSAMGTAHILISDQLTPTLRKFVQFGRDGITSLTDAFKKDGLNGVVREIPKVVRKGLKLVLKTTPKIIKAAGKIMAAVGKSIIDSFPEILKAVDKFVRRDALPTIAKILTKITGKAGLGSRYGKQLNDAFKTIKNIISTGANTIASVYNSVIQPLLTTVIEWVLGKLLPALSTLWNTALRPLVERLTEMLPALWEKLEPIVNKALDFISGQLIPAITNIINKVSGPLTNVISWMIDHLDTLIPIITSVVGAVLAFKGISSVIGIVKNVSTAISGLFSLIMANPIAALIATLAGLFIYLYQTNDDFRNKVDEVWESVKTTVLDAWEQHIKPALEALWTFITETLVPSITKAWEENIRPALEAAWSFLTETVGPAIKAIWDDIINPILIALWTAISEDIIPIVKDLWETHLKPFGEWIAGVFKDAWDGIVTLWNEVFLPALIALKEGVKDLWVNVIKPLANFLIIGFKNAWKAIGDFWNNVLSPALTILREAFQAFWDEIITPLATFLTETFIAAWKELNTFWTKDLQPRLTELSTAFNDFLETYIKPFATFLGEGFMTVWNDILNLFGGEEGVTATVNGVKTAFSDIWHTMLEPVAEYLAGGFADAWNGVKVVIKGLLDFVTKVFKTDWKNAWTTITTSFKNIFGKIVGAAKTPINSVIGFLNSLIAKVRDALNTIIDFINESLHIQIPSVTFDPNPLGGNFGLHLDYGNLAWDWSPGLDHINWSDNTIKKLAKGGIVKNGGHAIVGEGGYPEYLRVVNGQAIVTPMKNAAPAGTNVTINVYQQPGEDSQALAERIERLIAQKEMRRRSAMR